MSNLVLREDLGNGIAILKLNDPERRNAMSEEMAAAFKAAIQALRSDASVRAVILTGSGSAFSGGGDLNMLFEKTKIAPERNESLMMEFYSSFLCLRDLNVPVIAALNGHAVGAGLCIALACDVRIAADSAKLGMNFVLLGLHPGMGATYFLPRLLGYSRAAELLFSGSIVTAPDALRLGLVSQVVSADSILDEAKKIAEKFGQAGPDVLRQLKTTLRDSEYFSLDESLRREAQCQALNYAGEEFLEGISAAREKRKPKFAVSQ